MRKKIWDVVQEKNHLRGTDQMEKHLGRGTEKNNGKVQKRGEIIWNAVQTVQRGTTERYRK